MIDARAHRIVAGLLACSAAAVAPGRAALAAHGVILPEGTVTVAQVNQRAVVAFDGSREVLILQADLAASGQVQVVQFVPLPAKPEVSLAPAASLRALAAIIARNRLEYVSQYRGMPAQGQTTEPIGVTASADVAPRELSVVEIKDATYFLSWATGFFQKHKLGRPTFTRDLQEAVADYVRRGYRHFAFDLVTLAPKLQTLQPVVYQFQSERIYYPLKVSSLYGQGDGKVELVTALPADLRPYFTIAPSARIGAGRHRFRWSNEAAVTAAELAPLHRGVAALVGPRGVVQAFKYEGPMAFDADAWVEPAFRSRPDLVRWFFAALTSGQADRLAAVVDVPFAFDRQAVVTDKQDLMKRFAPVLRKMRGKPVAVGTDDVRQVRVQDVKDPFEREFIEKHVRPCRGYVARYVPGDVLFFIRPGEQQSGPTKIIGFSD